MARIGIIGGGFTGLTAAYELAKIGHQTFVFEQMNTLGGLASTLEVEGTRLEYGYHHWFTSDTHIIHLMKELGLGDRLMWIPSRVGFFSEGRVWNWVTPMDVMRYTPLPLIDRLRLGFSTYYLQTRRDKVLDYERITAAAWLKKYAGEEAWDKAWGPLFRGKFGDEAENVPLVWIWNKIMLRIGSRSGLSKEVLGYPQGSFQVLIDALEREILKNSGKVFRDTKIRRIVVEEGVARGLEFENPDLVGREGLANSNRNYVPFDAVLCTAPTYLFLRLVEDIPDSSYLTKLRAAKYMAAVILILKLKHPMMSSIYWLNIADRSIPFVGLIEHTNLVSSGLFNNKHIIYVSNYLHSSSPYYQMDAATLLQAYAPHLKMISKGFTVDWVEEYWQFKGAAAQPLFPLKYSHLIPEHRTPIPRLYLANTTQIYPEDRGTNYSVRLGQVVARLLDEDLANGLNTSCT